MLNKLSLYFNSEWKVFYVSAKTLTITLYSYLAKVLTRVYKVASQFPRLFAVLMIDKDYTKPFQLLLCLCYQIALFLLITKGDNSLMCQKIKSIDK